MILIKLLVADLLIYLYWPIFIYIYNEFIAFITVTYKYLSTIKIKENFVSVSI